MRIETLTALLQPLPREAHAGAVFNAAVALASLSESQVKSLLAELRTHPARKFFENLAWAARFER
jgi:hypothetical protein